LIKEIYSNASTAKNPKEMKRLLHRFVTKELFANENCPPTNNKRFFPREKTIRSHMVEAIRKLRHSKIDQECLLQKITEWKELYPDDSIFFRPKGEQCNTNELGI